MDAQAGGAEQVPQVGNSGTPQLPELPDLPQQADVVRRAVDYFQHDVRVHGLVLSGSLSHGEPDPWSDIDLYIIASEHFDTVFAERQDAAAAVGNPIAQFTVRGGVGQSSDHIVVYDDLVKLDLMYYRASEVEVDRKWSYALVLKDTVGHLTDVQQRSRSVGMTALPDELLLRLDQQFWAWTWYTFGKIMRGEQWEALDALHEIRSAAVLPLLLAVAEQHDEGYRRLESKLPDQPKPLARTVASLDAASQYDALREEIALFTAARDILYPTRGLPTNRTAEAVVRAAFERQWQERPRGVG